LSYNHIRICEPGGIANAMARQQQSPEKLCDTFVRRYWPPLSYFHMACHRFTRTWIFGGGLYIPLSGRLSLMSIDIGGRYFTGGEATYLRKGAIRDNPD
jgi:hypothetical protein